MAVYRSEEEMTEVFVITFVNIAHSAVTTHKRSEKKMVGPMRERKSLVVLFSKLPISESITEVGESREYFRGSGLLRVGIYKCATSIVGKLNLVFKISGVYMRRY